MAAWAKQLRYQAAMLPPGPEREALVKKAGQAETAAHLGRTTGPLLGLAVHQNEHSPHIGQPRPFPLAGARDLARACAAAAL